MSDLFWIIPLIVLGLTMAWLLGVWVISVFKNHEWRDILTWITVGANVLSLLSLGLWFTVQSSYGMQVTGLLVIMCAGLLLVLIWGALNQ